MSSRLYTIGHSNHPVERFVELLALQEIATVVDVRSVPYSKYSPQFRKEPLQGELGRRGLSYVFLGDRLGGLLRDPRYLDDSGQVVWERRACEPDFIAALERLIALASEARIVIACAEEDPCRCHRRMLLTPALRERAVEVIHLRGDGRAQADDALEGPRRQLSLF